MRSRRPERDGRFDRAQRPSRPDIQVEVSIIPEKKGSELLARQIKLTGCAYPLFEIARLVLAKPERYQVILKTIKKPDVLQLDLPDPPGEGDDPLDEGVTTNESGEGVLRLD